MANKGDIGRRTRYYQGVLDTATLPKGKDYSSLKETYIVFICTFDPFGLGLPVYTVEKVFKEGRGKKHDGEDGCDDIKYDDGANTIFYNCPAWEKCSEQQPRALMKYVDTQRADSELTHKIDERIKDERETQRLRSEYMTYQMRLDERYAEGVTIGSYERAVEDARAFLQMGLSPQQVAQGTGLPLDEVQSLL